MDTVHPPELILGQETHASRGRSKFHGRLGFSGFWSQFKRDLFQERGRTRLIGVSAFVLVGLLLFAPAVLYRLSLKSTSLIYFPFLWTIHDSLSEKLTVQQRLEELMQSETEWLKRVYSWFVVVALSALPLVLFFTLYPHLLHLLEWLDPATHPRMARLATIFVFATPYRIEIEGWHIARIINAALTIGLFLYADSALRQRRYRPTPLNVAFLTRGLLTLYVITCSVYVLVASVDWSLLPGIHVRLFPWSQ